MRALVVDDSRVMRSFLRRIVTEIGFDVEEAAHGLEALERLSEIDPVDLVLVDWNMPEMDGLELVTELRSNAAHDDTRVIMVTSESDFTRVAKALEAGADEYLMKPFNADDIRDKLRLIGIEAA